MNVDQKRREKAMEFPYLQCEAPKIAKLVYNSNNYGLWYANNYSYWSL